MSLYRPPCGGGRERQWPLTRACFQHKRGPERVQKYANTTQVPNPTCPDDWSDTFTPPVWPPLVAPYTRPDSAYADEDPPGRTGYPTDSDYCAPGHSTGLPWGPWDPSQLPSNCGGAANFDYNCYSLMPGEYLNLGVCWKMGFKNVQARHYWYGRFGFTDTDGSDCAVPISGCGADIPPTPDGTKYLTIKVRSQYNRVDTTGCTTPNPACGGGQGYNFSYDLQATFTIDRYSGVITRTDYSYDIVDSIGAEFADQTTTSNALLFLKMFCAQSHSGGDKDNNGWNWSCGPACAGDPLYFCECNAPNNTSPCAEDLSSGCDTRQDVTTFDCSNTYIHKKSQIIAVDVDGDCCGGQTTTEEIEAWLSDPYTATDFRNEVVSLLAEWDLADDLTYPWRTDSFTTVAPLVEYNCNPANLGPQCFAQNGTDDPVSNGVSLVDGAIVANPNNWTDPNATKYDGSLLGAPVPLPGGVAILQNAGFNSVSIAPPVASSISGKDPYPLPQRRVTIQDGGPGGASANPNGGIKLYDASGDLLWIGQQGVDYTYDSFNGIVTFPDTSSLLTVGSPPMNNVDSTCVIVINYTFDVDQGGHFDYRHETWHWQDPRFGVSPYRYGFGAWSASDYAIDRTDFYMPRCATHWTTNIDGGNLYHGAWQQYADGKLWMQKWAEIKVPRPSQNYFGPCGAQRYDIYNGNTSCVQNVTGDPPLVTVASGDGAKFTADDQVVYWSGAGDGGAQAGLYTVTSVSADDVQLSAKICDVPVAYQGGPMLGVLKFPDAWSICGRCEIEEFVDNGDGTLTVLLVTPAPYLRAGDSLDFTTGSSYPETISNSGITVTAVTNPTQFTVSASAFGLGGGALPTADHVKSHGAPGWWWYDVKPKGDFVFAKWGFNNRDIAIDSSVRANQALNHMPQNINSFSAIGDCLPFSVCYPQVMAISPNYNSLAEDSVDNFPNGVVYDFDLVVPDERYNSQWQAIIIQVMDDLFWAYPPKPCSTGDADDFGDFSSCGWLPDDGTCTPAADTCLGSGDGGNMYFPHQPVVEARAALPITWLPSDTAPALPDGIYIGYLTLDELDTTDEVHGNVLTPPPMVGFVADDFTYPPAPPDQQWTPWTLYFAEQSCICTNGRWAETYKTDGAIC